MAFPIAQGVHDWVVEKQVNVFLFVQVLYMRNKEHS